MYVVCVYTTEFIEIVYFPCVTTTTLIIRSFFSSVHNYCNKNSTCFLVYTRFITVKYTLGECTLLQVYCSWKSVNPLQCALEIGNFTECTIAV